jgi:hypothetical protein
VIVALAVTVWSAVAQAGPTPTPTATLSAAPLSKIKIQFLVRWSGILDPATSKPSCEPAGIRVPGCSCPFSICPNASFSKLREPLTPEELAAGFGSATVSLLPDHRLLRLVFDQPTALEDGTLPITRDFTVRPEVARWLGVRMIQVKKGVYPVEFPWWRSPFGEALVEVEIKEPAKTCTTDPGVVDDLYHATGRPVALAQTFTPIGDCPLRRILHAVETGNPWDTFDLLITTTTGGMTGDLPTWSPGDPIEGNPDVLYHAEGLIDQGRSRVDGVHLLSERLRLTPGVTYALIMRPEQPRGALYWYGGDMDQYSGGKAYLFHGGWVAVRGSPPTPDYGFRFE